ncbi:DUF2171 domain-containing protein [Crenalkalicoccus roseus]|uniref:DUF2171 domain-containing protein n=1 Tax=Crenalkalicoccus roseus TaxID=1485588 RepID=UPI0010803AB5|nr:DUF2171 domain-containing protein [Crenalkalicoccus roseus]
MDLTNIRPQMEVVGSDGGHVGTVDHVEHNRIKLTRSDREAGGRHHFLAQEMVAKVEGNTVRLACTAEEARRAWQAEGGGMGDAATGTGGQSTAHAPGRDPAR